jgi:group I intron endonuclease
MLARNCHHNIHLQRAWNKDGADKFTFVVVEFVDRKSELIGREQVALDAAVFNNEGIYNQLLVAGSSLGRKFSEETIKKFSIVHKGRLHTEASRKKMSEALRGVPIPRKIGIPAWNAGKKMDEAFCAKASARQKKRIQEGKGTPRGADGRLVSRAAWGADHNVTWSDPTEVPIEAYSDHRPS